MKFKDLFDFQNKYPAKEDRENELMKMSDKDIDVLIQTAGTKQGKAYLASFKSDAYCRKDNKIENVDDAN